MGRLLKDGRLCQRLHQHFLDRPDEWRAAAAALPVPLVKHRIGDRFNINFFAILSKDLDVFQQIGPGDEHDLTVTMPRRLGRAHYVDMHMTVSHLGFCTQRDGMDELHLLRSYARLAERMD
jgi:hypothetical protein